MHHTTSIAAALAAALLSACGGGGGSGGTGAGTLAVSLTDNPCGYRAVNVTIDRLRVHRSADAGDTDAGWTDVPLSLSPAQRRVDLLTLQNGALLKLGDVSLDAGSYTQLRLVLAENGGGAPLANAVTLADGSTVPLTTPSAQRSGVKLIHPFSVAPGQVVELTLDFDACKSIVVAGNSGRYSLKPTIAVVPMLDVGRIVGRAAPGALVSAQINAADGSPVVVKSTTAAPDGAFVLSPLPRRVDGARYTVVVAAPTADRASAVIKSVPVERQLDTVVANAAAPILPGVSLASVLSGRVTPAGLDGAGARAVQTVDGLAVEVAAALADGETGGFVLRVPRAAARVATHPPTAPAALPLSFADAGGAPGRYSVEASAFGRAPVATPVDATTGDQTVIDLPL